MSKYKPTQVLIGKMNDWRVLLPSAEYYEDEEGKKFILEQVKISLKKKIDALEFKDLVIEERKVNI